MSSRSQYNAVLTAVSELDYRLKEAGLSGIDLICFKDKRTIDALIWSLSVDVLKPSNSLGNESELVWHGISFKSSRQ